MTTTQPQPGDRGAVTNNKGQQCPAFVMDDGQGGVVVRYRRPDGKGSAYAANAKVAATFTPDAK